MLLKIILLILFFAVMIGVGIYCRRTASDVQGFVLGGRNVGSWLTAFAFTMYDMSKINVEGYFASEDTPSQRMEKRKALAAQRTKDYASGTYERAGGVIDPLPDDAPWFVKDYHAYYKTPRGYHKRSGNSNDGWNVIGCQSFMNQPLLAWAGEIENPVLLIHGEKAHSRYFSEYAFGLMTGANKELMIIPGATHVDLYDDVAGVIPYDKLASFFNTNLK